MASSKRVTTLSSAYDVPSDTTPSAVASIASRFDAPPPTTSRPAVAEKLSGIASAFGTTIDQDKIPGRSGGGRDLPQRTAATSAQDQQQQQQQQQQKAADMGVVAVANPKVGDTAARFDGRLTAEEAAPNAFASAHERFLRFEADARPPADTRVSERAKFINQADKDHRTAAKAAPTPPGREAVIAAPPPPPGSAVGGIASRFEQAAAADAANVPVPTASAATNGVAPVRQQQQEKRKKAEDEPKVDVSASGNDFASAAQRFAEAEKRAVLPSNAADQPPEETPQSRFADAARLFGKS